MSVIHKIRKQEGLCIYCGGAKDREGQYCIICHEKWNKWKLEYAWKSHEKGKCNYCGDYVEGEQWLCKSCSSKMNTHAKVRYAYRKANKLCVQCATPLIGVEVYCRRCLDMLKDRRAKKKK